MSMGPVIPRDPLALFENDGTREPPFLSKIYAPASLGVVGFLGVLVANWATKRPVLSGFQRHIFLTAACVVVGVFADNYRNKFLADRDAVFRHYIQLHYEDFAPKEVKKYKDVLEPWTPIR